MREIQKQLSFGATAHVVDHKKAPENWSPVRLEVDHFTVLKIFGSGKNQEIPTAKFRDVSYLFIPDASNYKAMDMAYWNHKKRQFVAFQFTVASIYTHSNNFDMDHWTEHIEEDLSQEEDQSKEEEDEDAEQKVKSFFLWICPFLSVKSDGRDGHLILTTDELKANYPLLAHLPPLPGKSIVVDLEKPTKQKKKQAKKPEED